jgi:hypothetical protein
VGSSPTATSTMTRDDLIDVGIRTMDVVRDHFMDKHLGQLWGLTETICYPTPKSDEVILLAHEILEENNV